MNPELIQRLGEYSNTLLASDEFKNLNLLFEQQVAVDILSTTPDDTKGRERLYATLQGTRAFTVHIQGFANDYVRSLPSSINAAALGPDIDDPSVHDISFESS